MATQVIAKVVGQYPDLRPRRGDGALITARRVENKEMPQRRDGGDFLVHREGGGRRRWPYNELGVAVSDR
jgi:hypothetical protein